LQYVGSEHTAVYYAKVAIVNKVSDIYIALERFEEFAKEHQLSTKITMQIDVVFDELLANIINYGYTDKKEHVIDIEIRYNGEKVIIIFSDDGMSFNPFERTAPDTELSLDEREMGGLGIHIVKKKMDDYSYKRTVGKNIISITKREPRLPNLFYFDN